MFGLLLFDGLRLQALTVLSSEGFPLFDDVFFGIDFELGLYFGEIEVESGFVEFEGSLAFGIIVHGQRFLGEEGCVMEENSKAVKGKMKL